MSCSAGVRVECYLSRDVYHDAWGDYMVSFGVGLGGKCAVPLPRYQSRHLEPLVAQLGCGSRGRGTFAERASMAPGGMSCPGGVGEERYLC